MSTDNSSSEQTVTPEAQPQAPTPETTRNKWASVAPRLHASPVARPSSTGSARGKRRVEIKPESRTDAAEEKGTTRGSAPARQRPQKRNTRTTQRHKAADKQPQNSGGEATREAARDAARDGQVAQESESVGHNGNGPVVEVYQPPLPEKLPDLHLTELQKLALGELLEYLPHLNAEESNTMSKHDVVCEIIRNRLRRGGTIITAGVLEIRSEGFGFLRYPESNYLQCPEDVFVSQTQVRRFGLRTGDYVEGPVRDPREKERFALGRVDIVNGKPAAEARRTVHFESLTPLFPDRRIRLETSDTELSMRVMDIFTPIGFGQRGLIVAPPRTGKTVLLQKVANAISENHPEAVLIILLIDERPEEVTDMQRNTKAQVLSSTFDEAPERHVQVADMVIEVAKRQVENGKDVIILLDSITRLARAYNTVQPHSGKILSGGVDANALHKPKRFFGAARNIENGGSLTIIATALVDTGSRMDEVIFEEFKGTGNMELNLDRQLVEKRVFPAINIEKSGTRKEELLLYPEELNRTWILRRALTGVPPVEVMEMVLNRIKKTKSNAEFLVSIKDN